MYAATAAADKRLQILPGSQHGVALVAGSARARALIEGFLRKHETPDAASRVRGCAAHQAGCSGRLVEPVRYATEGPREKPADRARPGVSAGGRGLQQFLLPVGRELVDVGRGSRA